MDRRLLHLVVTLLVVGAAFAVALGVRPAAASAADPTVPTLTVSVTPDHVDYGHTVSVTGTLQVPDAPVTLWRQRADETDFTQVSSKVTADDGSFAFTPLPQMNTVYRVEYAGDGTTWAATSADVSVTVRPILTLTASAEVWQGQNVTLHGSLRPLGSGTQVTIERRSGGAWQTWSKVKLSASSSFSVAVKASRPGKLIVRAVKISDDAFGAAFSPSRRVKVRDGNPYGVPTSYAHFIVVDISQYKLYYHEHGLVVRVFPCVTGKPSTPTPLGQWAVYEKQWAPGGQYGAAALWYHGPYGIHGTDQPGLLSRFPRNYSHGCTRLYKQDILWLYAHCPVGTPVRNVP
jgi:L,D-transpeptidase catalytic domain